MKRAGRQAAGGRRQGRGVKSPHPPFAKWGYRGIWGAKCSAVALLLSILVTSNSGAVILDRVVAVVNDDVITLTEVQEEGLQAIRSIVRDTLGAERERQLRSTERQVLDELILRRLQLQEAKKEKIEASPAEVQSAIEELKKRNGLTSDEDLRTALSREMLSEEQFRRGILEQVILTKLVARQVRSKVVVLDEEVQQYYEQRQDQFREIPQFKIRHLLVTVPPQATSSEISRAKNRIEEAQTLLKKGTNFSTVAKQYSEGPLASSAGEIWAMKRGELAPELEQAALALPIGQPSDIITTQAGFHLIVVEERFSGRTLSFDQVKDRLRAILFDQKTETKFKEWIESLRTKANVEMKL
ncbi:Chaperone SurA precursor [Candidatus Methylomirabilis lanthanidiphila]|uniref:Chaperone SurA n=1 Tax=Candidatus Methylomirabilis lanthanidiphila TaxID=2211376 RepID=A0A564ZJI3_9BACT|nr:peptidylprolyl isomerase [Candidatus Methylomirabilis lanthanidiphila]VUZ85464.1 Chaperone SurA precursor [Candidatus Methylomirabilis lanthanidiphila]